MYDWQSVGVHRRMPASQQSKLCAGSGTGRQRTRVAFEGGDSPALTPSWLSASWNKKPGAGPPGVALEGNGSPTLPGGQIQGKDDAELAAVEEQVRLHVSCAGYSCSPHAG